MILICICSILFGCLTAMLSKNRGRSPIVWFFVGAGFGLFGLLFLLILPSLSYQENDVDIVIAEEKPKPQDGFLPPSNWFYLDEDKKVQGPLGMKEMSDLFFHKHLSDKTWVWHESIVQWNCLEKVPLLKETLLSLKAESSTSSSV